MFIKLIVYTRYMECSLRRKRTKKQLKSQIYDVDVVVVDGAVRIIRRRAVALRFYHLWSYKTARSG